MSTRAIVPVQLSLTEGDFYTLWAPTWKEHGSEWQAFLGDDAHVLLFRSPAELLTFLDSGTAHDLTGHPEWEAKKMTASSASATVARELVTSKTPASSETLR